MIQQYVASLSVILSFLSSIQSSSSYPVVTYQWTEGNHSESIRKTGLKLKQIFSRVGEKDLPFDQRIMCSGDGPNEYPNENPKKFIYCIRNNWNGRWLYYVYTCPEGSFFDPSIKACNFYSMENECDSGKRRQRQASDGDGEGEDGSGVICP